MLTVDDIHKLPYNLKIGITGTRKGGSMYQVFLLDTILERVIPEQSEVHHGDCVGFDAQAHTLALRRNIPITIHPPTILINRAYCTPCSVLKDEEGYRQRNHNIVDACDILVAAPLTDKQAGVRSGTWMTMRYAWEIGKEVYQLPKSPPTTQRMNDARLIKL